MFIKIPKASDALENQVTDESVYNERRHVLKKLGFIGASSLLGAGAVAGGFAAAARRPRGRRAPAGRGRPRRRALRFWAGGRRARRGRSGKARARGERVRRAHMRLLLGGALGIDMAKRGTV